MRKELDWSEIVPSKTECVTFIFFKAQRRALLTNKRKCFYDFREFQNYTPYNTQIHSRQQPSGVSLVEQQLPRFSQDIDADAAQRQRRRAEES